MLNNIMRTLVKNEKMLMCLAPISTLVDPMVINEAAALKSKLMNDKTK